MRRPLIPTLLLIMLVCGGCSDGQAPKGEETGRCFADRSCNPGLDCVSGFCVRLPDKGSLPADLGAADQWVAADLPQFNSAVTLWFDDGLLSTYQIAFPALKQRGWRAVLAVLGDRATAQQKFGPDGDDVMSWDQVRALQNAGWEISNHSMTHPHLDTITDQKVLYNEIVASRKALENLGLKIASFSFPYGEEGDAAGQSLINAYYWYWRSSISGVNTIPAERHIRAHFITTKTTAQELSGWLQNAAQTKGWLIIGLHAIVPQPKNDWQHSPAQFQQVLKAVADSKLPVVLPREVYKVHGYAGGKPPTVSDP